MQIDTNPDREEFSFEYVALLREEAPMGGCGIVCLDSIGLKEGQILKLKVGRMDPLRSEVVWAKKVDDGISAYGISFLE